MSPRLLRPGNTEEVAAIVTLARETRTELVPQGGNTGLVGGSIPCMGNDEIILSLQRMNRIRSLDALNDTITVEAGVVLAQVQQAAREADRLFPLSIGSEGSRSEEHTSELQSLMRISYAVFCLKKKNTYIIKPKQTTPIKKPHTTV